MYGKGISREGSVLDVGVDMGFVKKSGAWYTYDGEQLGQGRENAKAFLMENPEIMVEVSERIHQKVKGVVPAVTVASEAAGGAVGTPGGHPLPRERVGHQRAVGPDLRRRAPGSISRRVTAAAVTRAGPWPTGCGAVRPPDRAVAATGPPTRYQAGFTIRPSSTGGARVIRSAGSITCVKRPIYITTRSTPDSTVSRVRRTGTRGAAPVMSQANTSRARPKTR